MGCKKETPEPTQKVFVRAYSLQENFIVSGGSNQVFRYDFSDTVKGHTFEATFDIPKSQIEYFSFFAQNIKITDLDSLYIEAKSDNKKVSFGHKFTGGTALLWIQLNQLK